MRRTLVSVTEQKTAWSGKRENVKNKKITHYLNSHHIFMITLLSVKNYFVCISLIFLYEKKLLASLFMLEYLEVKFSITISVFHILTRCHSLFI